MTLQTPAGLVVDIQSASVFGSGDYVNDMLRLQSQELSMRSRFTDDSLKMDILDSFPLDFAYSNNYNRIIF